MPALAIETEALSGIYEKTTLMWRRFSISWRTSATWNCSASWLGCRWPSAWHPFSFRACDRRARERSPIDRVTNY